MILGRKRKSILRNTNNSKAAMAARQTERVTWMLLAILILFLVSEFPQAVLGAMIAVPEWGFFPCYHKLGDLLDMLVLCNCAINFILFCSMSRQFRVTFCNVFGCLELDK